MYFCAPLKKAMEAVFKQCCAGMSNLHTVRETVRYVYNEMYNVHNLKKILTDRGAMMVKDRHEIRAAAFDTILMETPEFAKDIIRKSWYGKG
jgi:hypothetical protein